MLNPRSRAGQPSPGHGHLCLLSQGHPNQLKQSALFFRWGFHQPFQGQVQPLPLEPGTVPGDPILKQRDQRRFIGEPPKGSLRVFLHGLGQCKPGHRSEHPILLMGHLLHEAFENRPLLLFGKKGADGRKTHKHHGRTFTQRQLHQASSQSGRGLQGILRQFDRPSPYLRRGIVEVAGPMGSFHTSNAVKGP